MFNKLFKSFSLLLGQTSYIFCSQLIPASSIYPKVEYPHVSAVFVRPCTQYVRQAVTDYPDPSYVSYRALGQCRHCFLIYRVSEPPFAQTVATPGRGPHQRGSPCLQKTTEHRHTHASMPSGITTYITSIKAADVTAVFSSRTANPEDISTMLLRKVALFSGRHSVISHNA